MNGRIYRPERNIIIPDLPEIGRLGIGEKKVNSNGREYPTSVDWFIPRGKYADLFTRALGDKPNLLQIVFHSDDPALVCKEEYQYRNDSGALVASGDGRTFIVWDGKAYAPYTVDEYPDIMEQITNNFRTKRGNDNWDIVLTMRFIVPAISGVVGLWRFTTKGRASSIRNITESFDGVKAIRGTVTGTVFDLAVSFAKSNKPDTNTRYPVVSMVANDNRIDAIRDAMRQKDSLSLLMPYEAE